MPVVVAFVSQKGGVGKSTLARALAAVAGHGGVRVLLADLDPQQSTAVRWERLRVQNAVVPSLTVKGFRSIDEALDAGVDFDLLIIDTPGNVTRGTLDIARAAHLVVQPTGPSIDDLDPAILLFHELIGAGLPRERLVMALCRTASKREEDEARAYLAQAGFAVLRASIPERPTYRAAQNRGYGLTETKERALNDRADALMSELLSRVAEAIAAQRARAQSTSRQGEGGAA